MADKQDVSPEKGFRIIINGTSYIVPRDEVTFDEIVDLAFPNGGRGELITYIVTFYNGGGRPPEGPLAEGEKAKVTNGTVFNATRTDRS